MAYLKPSAVVAKVFNRVAMATGLAGVQTLTVLRRTTGDPQVIPVIPVEVSGALYVVSTRGEAEWVRNLRADPTATIKSRSGTTGYQAVELPVEERPPVIDAYRNKAGRTVDGYWKRLPDPADHPVFRLT